jgi:predicted P-loop ATPase
MKTRNPLVEPQPLIVNDGGKARPLLANAIIVLRESPEWEGVLAFNEFTLYAVTKNAAPWQDKGGSDWTGHDDSKTSEWLQHHGVLVNSKLAGEAVQVLARENSFHPVRDYLRSLEWDGVGRIDHWLTAYAGVEGTVFSAAVGARWLISGVARIMQPGCRVDHTLILEGPQGIKKSTLLETLAGAEWFADQISDLNSKDSKIELHGIWILELAELANIKRSQIERVKSFLTSPSDHFRVPYATRASHVPRQNIFAGSVNDPTYLDDETGNRRFWPVRCGEIDIAGMVCDRDQLWAEAFDRYKAGCEWWLETSDLNEVAGVEQEIRYDAGAWDDVILSWLENPLQRLEHDPVAHRDMPVEPFTSTRDKVTLTEILLHAIGKQIQHFTQADKNSVARCLKHNGWKRTRAAEPDARGIRPWFYVRPEALTEEREAPHEVDDTPI